MDYLVPAISALIGGGVSATLKGPAESLSQIWQMTIGHKIDIKHKKMQLQLEQLAKETINEMKQIPEEHIQEPRLNIAAQTLEVAKFNLEEKEIRSMFAKLLASSMDSRKNDISQPAFPDIIKQLTPLDAVILTILYNNTDYNDSITCIHLVDTENNDYHVIQEHVYLKPEIPTPSEKKVASSIVNLIRLGILTVDYSVFFTNNSRYTIYELYVDEFKDISVPENKKLELKKGIIKLTNLGIDFCKICL